MEEVDKDEDEDAEQCAALAAAPLHGTAAQVDKDEDAERCAALVAALAAVPLPLHDMRSLDRDVRTLIRVACQKFELRHAGRTLADSVDQLQSLRDEERMRVGFLQMRLAGSGTPFEVLVRVSIEQMTVEQVRRTLIARKLLQVDAENSENDGAMNSEKDDALASALVKSELTRTGDDALRPTARQRRRTRKRVRPPDQRKRTRPDQHAARAKASRQRRVDRQWNHAESKRVVEEHPYCLGSPWPPLPCQLQERSHDETCVPAVAGFCESISTLPFAAHLWCTSKLPFSPTSGTPRLVNYDYYEKDLKLDGLNLQFAPFEVTDHVPSVLAAVRNRGVALEDASERVQKDVDVCTAAVLQNPFALKFVQVVLPKKVLARAVLKQPLAVAYLRPDVARAAICRAKRMQQRQAQHQAQRERDAAARGEELDDTRIKHDFRALCHGARLSSLSPAIQRDAGFAAWAVRRDRWAVADLDAATAAEVHARLGTSSPWYDSVGADAACEQRFETIIEAARSVMEHRARVNIWECSEAARRLLPRSEMESTNAVLEADDVENHAGVRRALGVLAHRDPSREENDNALGVLAKDALAVFAQYSFSETVEALEECALLLQGKERRCEGVYANQRYTRAQLRQCVIHLRKKELTDNQETSPATKMLLTEIDAEKKLFDCRTLPKASDEVTSQDDDFARLTPNAIALTALKIKPREIEESLRWYQKQAGGNTSLHACATCGVYGLDVTHGFTTRSIAWLRDALATPSATECASLGGPFCMTPDEAAAFTARPSAVRAVYHAVRLRPTTGSDSSSIILKVAKEGLLRATSTTVEEGGAWFDDDADGSDAAPFTKACLCSVCDARIRDGTPGKAPLDTYAAEDWGRIVATLSDLNEVERVAISFAVPVGKILKLRYPSTDASHLSGHIITCMTDAADRTAESLSSTAMPRKDLCKYIQFSFLGRTHVEWSLCRRVNQSFGQIGGIRPIYVYRALRLLRQINPEYADVVLPDGEKGEAFDAWAAPLKDMSEQLCDNALLGSNAAAAVDAAATADIAAVTPQADGTTDALTCDNADGSVTHVSLSRDVLAVTPDEAFINALDSFVSRKHAGKEAAAASLSGGEASAAKPAIRASMEVGTPINEFDNNPMLLARAYPVIFPFGRMEMNGKRGGLPRRTLTRLAEDYRGRLNVEPTALLHLANQKARHSTAGNVALRVRGGGRIASRFVDAMNDPGIYAALRRAHKLPNGTEAKKLVAMLSPLVNLAGKATAWSPLKRANCVSDLMALCHLHHAPSFFVTIAPALSGNPLSVRMTLREVGARASEPAAAGTVWVPTERGDGHEQYIDFELPATRARTALMARNPTIAARMYDVLCRGLLDGLLGMKYETVGRGRTTSDGQSTTRRGVLGKIRAYYGVTEAQARGALHLHLLVWGEISPRMMQRFAHDPSFQRSIAQVIDSLVSTELPDDIASAHSADVAATMLSAANLRAKRTAKRVGAPRPLLEGVRTRPPAPSRSTSAAQGAAATQNTPAKVMPPDTVGAASAVGSGAPAAPSRSTSAAPSPPAAERAVATQDTPAAGTPHGSVGRAGAAQRTVEKSRAPPRPIVEPGGTFADIIRRGQEIQSAHGIHAPHRIGSCDPRHGCRCRFARPSGTPRRSATESVTSAKWAALRKTLTPQGDDTYITMRDGRPYVCELVLATPAEIAAHRARDTVTTGEVSEPVVLIRCTDVGTAIVQLLPASTDEAATAAAAAKSDGLQPVAIAIEKPPAWSADPSYRLPPQDDRILYTELARRSDVERYASETSLPISAAIASNTNVQFTAGSATQGRASAFYTIKYVAKDPNKIAAFIAVVYSSMRKCEQYPSKSPDAGSTYRNTCQLLNKVINQMHGMKEQSVEQAAASLLGMKCFYASTGFWYVYTAPAVRFILSRGSASAAPDAASAALSSRSGREGAFGFQRLPPRESAAAPATLVPAAVMGGSAVHDLEEQRRVAAYVEVHASVLHFNLGPHWDAAHQILTDAATHQESVGRVIARRYELSAGEEYAALKAAVTNALAALSGDDEQLTTKIGVFRMVYDTLQDDTRFTTLFNAFRGAEEEEKESEKKSEPDDPRFEVMLGECCGTRFDTLSAYTRWVNASYDAWRLTPDEAGGERDGDDSCACTTPAAHHSEGYEAKLDASGTYVAASQLQHYLSRGKELKDLCFYFYLALFGVYEKSSSQAPQGRGKERPALWNHRPGAGRHKNAAFQFDEKHPWSDTHEQRLRNTPVVLSFAGKGAPKQPGAPPADARSTTYKAWAKRAEKFAVYFTALFVPFTREEIPESSFEDFNKIVGDWLHPRARYVDRIKCVHAAMF